MASGKIVIDSGVYLDSIGHIKFPNGLMIAHYMITDFVLNANTTTTKTYTFSVPFKYTPTIVLTANTSIPDKLHLSTYGVSATQFVLNGVSSFTSNQGPVISVMAIGRWK